MHDLMLFTKIPHPTPHTKTKENTPVNFKTVISFTDLLTKLSI